MKIVNRTKPRGYTLFEMVLTVAGATVVLGSCAVLLHGLLRLDHVAHNHMTDTLTMNHLAEQFRQDVRTARKAERGVSEKLKTPTLTLTTPDAPTITYEIVDTRLLRTETLADKVVRREAYPIERLGPVEFEEEGAFVRLVLLRKPDDPGAILRPVARFDARLAKHRLEPLAAEAKR